MVKVVRTPRGIDMARLEPPQEDWISHCFGTDTGVTAASQPKVVVTPVAAPQPTVPPLKLYVPEAVQVGPPVDNTPPNK